MEKVMKYIIKDQEGTKVLFLDGRLDMATGGVLKEEISKLCANGSIRIHLNFNKIDFINSSGLGALVSIMKQVRLNNGRLTLSNMASYVREIFDLTQLSHVFEIYDSQAEALASNEKETTKTN